MTPEQVPGYPEDPRIYQGMNFKQDVIDYTGRTLESFKEQIESEFNLPQHEAVSAADGVVNGMVPEDPTLKQLTELYDHPLLMCEGMLQKIHAEIHTNSFAKGHAVWDELSIWPRKLGKERPRVLVHGCGNWVMAYTFWVHGFDVVCCDLPLKWLVFEEFRCKKYGIDIKFIPVLDDLAFLDGEEPFDVIESNCVLEHLRRPEETVAYITDFCNDRTIAFWHVLYHCGGFHLAENIVFRGEKDGSPAGAGSALWRNYMLSLGWEQYFKYPLLDWNNDQLLYNLFIKEDHSHLNISMSTLIQR